MARTECLTHAELAAFHLGELPPTELEELAAHLESCPRCEAAAGELDGLSDPLVDAYRRSARGSAPNAPSVMPQQVGDYEILDEVGRGGMGVVYRARHRQLHRVVALKMLLGGSFAGHEERVRFRAEAEAVARLHHAHIVQIYEIGEFHGEDGVSRPFFTLELVDGGNLAARVSGQPQPPGQAAAWVETLARATHYAHGQGIIHRDLKPSNVLLTADGEPKICDFGVAKLLTGSDLKTRSGMLVGTAEYMAPEQALGETPTDPAADIYALGAILYTLLTGRPPFQGMSPLHTLEQVRHQEPVTPGRLQPRIPRDLETVCLKCLEKAPAKRYASALDLADDLRRFLGDEPIRARRATPGERVTRWARRHKTLALALAAVILSLATATVISVVAAVQKEAERVRARDAEAVAVAALKVAEVERDRALRNLYVARTNLTSRVLDGPVGLSQLAQFFNDWRGRHLRDDPRGWEWYYYQTLANRSERTLHGHPMDVASLAWSPDGGRLASGGMDGTIRLWDAATGRQLSSFPSPQGILGLAWKPDGERLASVDFPDKTVSVWDAATGTCLRRLSGHDDQVWAVAWNPDGHRLASADATGTVLVWGDSSDQPLFALKGTAVPKGCVCWSPDGRRLAAGNSGAEVRIWDGTSGELVTTLAGHKGQVAAVAWSKTGTLATLARDETLVLWDAAKGTELRRLSVPEPEDFPQALAWSPDGRRLAVGRLDLTVAVWDAETGEQPLLLRGHTGSHIAAVCWSPDGARLASAERGWNGTIKVWKTEVRPERPLIAGDSTEPPTDLCWSPDSRTLASGHKNGVIRLWNVTTRECLATLQEGTETMSHIRWSPDGRWLAGGGDKGTVHVWDAARRQHQATLPGDGSGVTALSWSGDGTRLVCGVEDWRVTSWAVATGARQALGRLGISAALRPQSDSVAAGQSYGMQIFDAASGAELRSWRNAEVTHNHPHWDPTGTHIASLSDFAVDVRDAATGRLPFAPLAHFRRVERFAWSPDGRQLVSVTDDNNLHLWDAVGGNLILTLPGPAPHVHCLAWSPDGTRIAAADADGRISVWDATPGFASERAPALLASLDARLGQAPEDRQALRLRAGVHARREDWDQAAADAERLGKGGGPELFQAGWWVADLPVSDSSTSQILDPFQSGPEPFHARWYISADDPNGYVPLHQDQTYYLTRFYAVRAEQIEVHLEADADLHGRLWLNGEPVESPETATLSLTAGWNTVTVRLEERTPLSSVLLRHGIGFHLRLPPAATAQ